MTRYADLRPLPDRADLERRGLVNSATAAELVFRWQAHCPACGTALGVVAPLMVGLFVAAVHHPAKDDPGGIPFYGPRSGWWKTGRETRGSSRAAVMHGQSQDYSTQIPPIDTVCTNRACARRCRIDPRQTQ